MEHGPKSGGAWSQPGSIHEKTNGDLVSTHTILGNNKQISSNSTHLLSECTDDIHHFAELSFRMDFPSEMMSSPYTTDTFGTDSLRGSSDMSSGNGVDSVASFANEGDVVLQYKTQLSLKQSAADMQFTSFGQVDVGKENMWRNNRDPRISGSDAWMRESNNAESRVPPGLTHADYIDERLMNFGVKEFSSLPYKGPEPSNFSLDNELNRNFWLNRELQSQALSSRKFSRSVNGGSNNMGGFHLERSSTGPRFGPFVNREEDLYSSQEMVPIHRNNHRTQTEVRSQQKIPQLEEELYPVMTTMMNYQVAAPFNQGYVAANSFASKKGLDSHRAAFEGAMMNYAPNYNNRPAQNLKFEGSFTGPLDYPMHSFAGPYEHPHARFQEYNRQFSGDSYSLQQPCDGAYNFPKPLHQLTGHPFASQREMSLVSTSKKCTCCKEHTQLHSSFKPQPLAQYPPLGYQHVQTPAHFQDYTYRKLSSKSSQNSLRSLQLHRKAVDPLSEAVRARKESCPPLPGPFAPPYVLCQGCDKIIQIPPQIYFESAVVKLRCGACRRVSKLCNIVHPCYQALIKEGRATSSKQQANRSDSFNKQELLSTAATKRLFEQNPAVQEPMAAKVNEEFKSICLVESQHDKQDTQIETNGPPSGVGNLNTRTPKMVLEQVPDNNEWMDADDVRRWSRSETFHEDSSSLFSVSGSGSTKNTAGLKSHESQQLETNADSLSQCTMPEDCVQAKESSVVADSVYEQQSDNGPAVSSEELQGLMLECIQESCYDDSDVKKKDSFTHQRSHSHQQKHDEPVCLNNDKSQESASSPPKGQILHMKQSDSVRSSTTSYKTILSPTEQTECCNPELGHGESEGANSALSGPAPGSPLYEYLSYDTASEIVEALKSDVEGKPAASAPCSKGSNFLTSFLKKNIHLHNAGQGNNKNMSVVVVNGTIIPLDAIKNAQKQAGAIRPGVYWYDYQAGFWGVMGGPCLGIIPPFIAEFKLPLAKDCAGGTTGVFVNGRELHKKDLDALAGRGLPRTAGKSYMVDISGQVVDSSSGQMLRSLGRLAPTVQKRGRGCGMFQPPRLP